MQLQILPFFYENKAFYVSPYTGKMYKVNKNIFNKNKINTKVDKALKLVDNPFIMKTLDPLYDSVSINYNLKKITFFHNILLKLGNKNFFLARLFMRIGPRMFNTTIEAFDAISKIEEQVKFKNELCLQRSFLAAKLSKSFKKSGVLFIGASFPSGKMHAWIIEEDVQPDRIDREWIMYRPLLALYYI